jgi:polar amino acid transport system substrate-binding protein
MNPVKLFIIILFYLASMHAQEVSAQDSFKSPSNPRIVKIVITHAPPLVYLEENKAPVGMMIDFLEAVAKLENWRIIWVSGTWSSVYEKAQNKQLDVMSYIAYSQARTVYFNFSQESFVTGWGQVYKHKDSNFQNIFDYQKKEIALVKDDIHANGFIDLCHQFNVNCQFKYVDNYDVAFDMLKNKLVDGVVAGSTVGFTYEQKFEVSRTSIMYKPTDSLFATPKNKSTDLLGVFDQYLSKWKKDSKSPYSVSKNKWMNSVQNNIIPQWLFYLVLMTFILLVFAGILVNLLRNKIKKHIKQYKEQSKQLNQIINLVPHMIYVVNSDGRVVLSNNYASDYFGISSNLNTNSHQLLDEMPQYQELFEDDKDILNKIKGGIYKEVATKNYAQEDIVFNISKLPFDNFNNSTSILTVGVDITEELAYQEKINFIAEHDDLTGLPNRNCIKRSIQNSLLDCKKTLFYESVLYIDLDFFKNVNDSLGHAAGDKLLTMVSDRLKPLISENDVLARIGGDEFVLQLKNVSKDYMNALMIIKEFSNKILKSLAEKFLIHKNELYISASIGIIIYPKDANSFIQIMQRADIAMYRAKEKGKNCFVLFEQNMEDSVLNKHALIADLHKATENHDFFLEYQPQIQGNNKKLIGLEALIRWNHTNGDTIQPSKFIPEAEECGLIIPIGYWVIEEACKQLSIWLKKYEKVPLITINVSVLQIHHVDFYSKLQYLLNEYSIPAHLIELELTETIMVKQVEKIIYTLSQLKNLGIKLSIDDFGTGYSSLSYLKKLPFDKLKIDYSFVKDMTSDEDTKTLVKTIVGMTQDLDLEVIAEGVETIEQVNLLTKMGCHQFQGFYFDYPSSVEYIQNKYF